jgi:formate dehydrogenase assembly factor FdhD
MTLNSPRTRWNRAPFGGWGILILVALSACVSGGERSGSRTLDFIPRTEIEQSSARNAYDLIRQTRPTWLRTRGTTSFIRAGGDPAIVYIGTNRHGALDTLYGIETEAIESIQFINATAATTRFGMGHSGGVIQITLRRSA